MTDEKWVKIKGYDGLYEISNYGNIISYKRSKTGKLMKLTPNKYNQYYVVSLNKFGKCSPISVHREVYRHFIGGLNKNEQVDHIDRIRTNNHYSNLRKASNNQNGWNMGVMKDKKTSIYKGVSFKKDYRKYIAQIMCRRKHFIIGYYDDPKDAAMAYDCKAEELFGEFCCTNKSMGLYNVQEDV